jgi:hypothetical protein
MVRRCFCRFCGHPAELTAGVLPASCAKCDEAGFWTTEPHAQLIERRKRGPRRPRMKFATTVQDYRLFLRRIRVSPD